MEPLLLFPDRRRRSWLRPSTSAGYPWKAVGDPTWRAHRTRRRLGRRSHRRRRGPRSGLRRVPGASQTGHAPRAVAAPGQRRPVRRPGAARRPLRRLLPHAFHPRELEARLQAPLLAQRRGHPARAHRVWRPRAQPGDLPGRGGGSPLDLTYMEYELLKFLARIRARSSPARRCSRGCGATSTTAAPARSTSTSGASGPSSARSMPASSRPCGRWATASASPAGESEALQQVAATQRGGGLGCQHLRREQLLDRRRGEGRVVGQQLAAPVRGVGDVRVAVWDGRRRSGPTSSDGSRAGASRAAGGARARSATAGDLSAPTEPGSKARDRSWTSTKRDMWFGFTLIR